MLQSVTPHTLELIEFILKQQILLKHDSWDVILNKVAFLSFLSSFPATFFHFFVLVFPFFFTNPYFSAVDLGLYGVLLAI